jgi:protein kinase-like protein/WD40 repeat protein
MALVAGTRLGPYEILSAIGTGGMGEVYRARDTRLKRDVALKILPESFSNDPERLARFQREAEVLASLNHPNIAQIYGIEESNGTGALVMELVEGETLAERIARGLIPLDEALPIAKQIAEALEAAHEQGIIHRDLKPANIKVRSDGTVKVLDFGLAKLTESVGNGQTVGGASLSPTITSPAMMTGVGVLLGTAAYMAPEQARGKAIDKRADIWAFGCVLFEMLTGKRAFAGEDVTDTLAAVVKSEPEWAALPDAVSPTLRVYLRRCLYKDSKKRVHDIGDVRLALEGAFEPVLSNVGGPHTSAQTLVEAAVSAARRETARFMRRRLAAVGAASFVIGVAVAGAILLWATRAAPPGVLRTEVTTSGATVLNILGTDRDLAITPDGSRIVYRGTGQLLVRALDQLGSRVLSGLEAPRGPFVSPDGQWVGFFDGAFLLKKVAMSGGPPVSIGQIDGVERGATWGPDGTIVYATANPATGLQRVSAAGGDPTVLTKPDRERGEGDHLWPEFLPGGQAVLFTITAATGGLDNAQIAVLDFVTGKSKVVVRGGHHAHYLATGHLVYGAGGTLRAVAFDRSRLEVSGTPVPVIDHVVTAATGAVDMAIAANGTMVYVPGDARPTARSLVWVDRLGREEPVSAPRRAFQYPRISPDGTRVALDVRDEDLDIWIWDFASLTFTRLTFDPGGDEYPVWMPDSRRVIFGSGPPNAQNLYWKAADGTGSAERLTQSPSDQDAQSVSPDGKLLVFRETGASAPTRSIDLMLLTLPVAPASSRPSASRDGSPLGVKPLTHTVYAESTAEISPGGQWLAYESNESGREEIYIRPFPEVDSGRWQVSTGGGRTPVWSRNGEELFYVSTEDALMGVRVNAGSPWHSTTPARVFQGKYFYGGPGTGTGRTYDIAPDGRRFLMIKEDATNEAAPQNLVLVQHFDEELKRLVPTK